MPGINAMIRRMESVNMKEVVQVAVTGTVKNYEKLQQFQMLTGKDSEGEILGKYKNKKYAAKKFAKNQLAGFGNMDFRLTGDFFKEFFTRIGGNSVFIGSTNNKTARLLKINKNAFGLSPENSKEYSIQYIKPTANKIIKRQLSTG